MHDDARASRPRFRWRPALRALHRDLGYLAVGLTLVYAASGIAVNHLSAWDPNFVNFEREFVVSTPLPTEPGAAAQAVLDQAGRGSETPVDVYQPSEGELEITLGESTLFVALQDGRVYEEGQRPRPILRALNWLHLNRGKKAWTYFADGYAIALLLLASTGMFMIPGRKGLLGRGAWLVGLGVVMPLMYLVWVGGPG